MSTKTAIAWTDSTFNPWWGCVKVSDGCTNCYALDQAKRFGHNIWGPAATTPRRIFGSKHWQTPLRWNSEAELDGRRHRVFCASMADVFEQHPMVDAERLKLWSLIALTPALDWQLLTKRPENVLAMVPPSWLDAWPANVWMGTSVEHQLAADIRIPRLLEIPAPIRWLSCEPLLGPVDLTRWTCDLGEDCLVAGMDGPHHCSRNPIRWVITGGESGPNHRPLNLDWVRSIRDQCLLAGIRHFFKQVGGRTHAAGGRLLDGREWSEFPTPAGVP